MSIKQTILLFFCITSLVGCKSFDRLLVSQGQEDTVINNAILDFTHTSKLYKQDDVFSIRFYEDVRQMELLSVDERVGKWVEGTRIFPDIVAVSIQATNQKFLRPSEQDSTTTSPNRYIELNNKLFYWQDVTSDLQNDEILEVLDKYGLLIDNSLNGQLTFLDFEIDDSKKGVHYFFCKSNLTNYQKMVTNVAIGYYPIPKTDCK